MKNVIKLIIVITLIFFFTLYFGTMNGYYNISRDNTTLTNEAIKKFEKDVSEGKQIDATNYLEPEVNYNNNASKIGLRLSKYTESIFDKIMNFIFTNIESTINS